MSVLIFLDVSALVLPWLLWSLVVTYILLFIIQRLIFLTMCTRLFGQPLWVSMPPVSCCFTSPTNCCHTWSWCLEKYCPYLKDGECWRRYSDHHHCSQSSCNAQQYLQQPPQLPVYHGCRAMNTPAIWNSSMRNHRKFIRGPGMPWLHTSLQRAELDTCQSSEC